MKEKHHKSLSAEYFCLQIHLYSQGTTWEMPDNGYSVVEMPCPAEINDPFIFRHKWAWKKRPQAPESTMIQEMRPTSCTVFLPERSFFFYFCTTLSPFHTLRDFTNCCASSPRGEKSCEQKVNSSTADEHAGRKTLAVVQSCPDLLPWFTSCFMFTHRESTENNRD